MKRIIYIIVTVALACSAFADASAQLYRRENRKGNRAFGRGDYDGALEHYSRSLSKDTVNVIPHLYNMSYVLHSDRRDSTQNMIKDSLAMDCLNQLAEAVEGTQHEFDYHFNKGVLAIDMQDWQLAVDEFKKCLIMNPDDMLSRENYIYAKRQQSENNENSGGGGGQDPQNQDQNQNGDQDQNGDQNQNDQNQLGQNKDQDGNQDQKEQGQDKKDQNDQQDNKNDQGGQDQPEDKQEQHGDAQPQESKISPQAAKQILQAMQAKEKETQDKVEKKKAAAMKSKQKVKNW